MMKRINEQRLVATIPAALRRWLRENPESRHLVDPAPMIKGEEGSMRPEVKAIFDERWDRNEPGYRFLASNSEQRRSQGRTVQQMLF